MDMLKILVILVVLVMAAIILMVNAIIKRKERKRQIKLKKMWKIAKRKENIQQFLSTF